MFPRVVFLAACALLTIGCSTSGNSSPDAGTDGGTDGGTDALLDEFFGLTIHDIEVELDEDAVESLIAEPRVYTHACVTIDDTVFEDVGLRLKGSAGSFVPLGGTYPEISGDGNGNPGKSAFILDFNRFVDGQNHLGLRKLTVNNLVQDPSCIHEFLGYSLFRAGEIPACRSGWAMVTMNNEEKGIYAIIETPDNKEFLDKYFGQNDGNLYEGQYGTDFVVDGIDDFDQDNGDDTSKDDLHELAQALDAIDDGDDPLPVLDLYFDIDDYLTYAATELYLDHWDGYANSANNFAVYHNPNDDMWTFLPWGIDQVFEGEINSYMGVMSGPGPSWDNGGRIHQLCFQSQQCLARLHTAFEDLFDRIEEIDLASLAQEARDLVESQALAEANAHGDPNLTTETLDRIFDRIENRGDNMTVWLPCLIGGTVDTDNDTHDGCTEDCNDQEPDIHPGAEEICDFVDQDCNGILDDPSYCPKCMDITGPGEAPFAFCIEMLSWSEAEDHCVTRGQHLASVHSEEEWEFVTWELIGHFEIWESWTGLSDTATEGLFVWTDGEALDHEHWCEGSPNQGDPTDDCVVNSPEGWRDINCNELRQFVCRTP